MSFSDVSGASKYFVTPNEGFSTTTSGTVASGATTVGLNSVSGLTNGTTFVGVIEPAGTKEQIFTGVVDTSGSQITGVVWTKGSNIDHATGVSVVDYDTGTALKLMTTGLLKEHTQTGTHGAITGTSANVTGALTGTSLVNATHTHANAAGGGQLTVSALGTDSSWAWQTYNPNFTNLTVGNGTLVAKYAQIGKNVYVRMSLIWGSTTSIAGDVSFTLPVTSVAYAGGANLTPLGTASLYDQSATRIYQGYVAWATTTTATLRAYAADASFLYHFLLSSTAPMTWTTSDEISTQLIYESA